MKIGNQAKYFTLDIFFVRSSVAGLWLDYLSIPLQVTYKKFQIACPFEEFSVNGTANLLSLNVSSAHSHDGHEYTNGVAHEDDDSHCATHLFTINSQVGSCIEHWLCLSHSSFTQVESGVSTLGFSMTMTKVPTFPCPWQTAYTIPILAFAFVCHPEVLPIYTELRKWVNAQSDCCEIWRHVSVIIFYPLTFSLISVRPSRECRRCLTSPSLSCTLCTSWRLSLATWPLKVRAGTWKRNK